MLDLSGTGPGAAVRAGPSFWIAVKTTRPCSDKPDFRAEEERSLTIDDARNPAMPWLCVGEPDDFEDREFAASWTRSHTPEKAPHDQYKKV